MFITNGAGVNYWHVDMNQVLMLVQENNHTNITIILKFVITEVHVLPYFSCFS